MWRDVVRRIQLVGGLALGAAAMGAFLWGIDWVELGTVVGRVSWRWLAVATGAMLADYFVQGARFRLLLADLAPGLSWGTTWRSTTVMWAGNTLLPMRAGLVLRAVVVSRDTGASFTSVFSTLVAETVCDLLGVVGLLLVTIALIPAELSAVPALQRLRDIGTWAGAVALVLLGLVVLLSGPAARSMAGGLLARVPNERLRGLLATGFDQVVTGMAVVRDPRRFALALGWTVLVWAGWWVGIAATLAAFGLDVGAAGALFLETALTLSMLVPQAPGFLGVFQVVCEEALGLFGVAEAEAEAVALLFWTVCFVPVTAIGVVDGWRSGLRGPA
jgi:uncharacterized protein (TIRG00374 family)